jgi:hypothetical protein
MIRFLQELVEELDQIEVTRVEEPKGEIKHGDIPVGTCSDELKKLYGLRTQAGRKVIDLRKQIFGRLAESLDASQETLAELEEIEGQRVIADLRLQAIDNLFWVAVRSEFPAIAARCTIAIRKGWLIVWCKKDDEGIRKALLSAALLERLLD